jgi:hypothetical protein
MRPGSGGNAAPTAHVIDVDATIGTLTARDLDQPLADGNLPRGVQFRLSDCADLLTTAPFPRVCGSDAPMPLATRP